MEAPAKCCHLVGGIMDAVLVFRYEMLYGNPRSISNRTMATLGVRNSWLMVGSAWGLMWRRGWRTMDICGKTLLVGPYFGVSKIFLSRARLENRSCISLLDESYAWHMQWASRCRADKNFEEVGVAAKC
jgi:hypothetical protein